MRTIVFIASTGLLLAVRQHLTAGETYSQQPTIAASQVRGEVDSAPSKPDSPSDRKSLDGGPKPTCIWGPDARKRYVLTKEFQGGSTNAWIEATCDNQMTLFVNDKRIASSTEWQQSVEVDIQKHLLPGNNTLRAELDNEGSVAGFACKIALTMPSGEVNYVVSNEDWSAAELGSPQTSVAVKTHGQMGVGPWGDVFSKPAGMIAKDRDVFNVHDGFQVELLYTVPKDKLGSWVSITFDDQGRLIASDQGDIPMLLDEGRAGVLVPQPDLAAWQAALDRVLNDDRYRRSLGQAARRFVLSNFTWHHTAGRVEHVLRRVLADGHPELFDAEDKACSREEHAVTST